MIMLISRETHSRCVVLYGFASAGLPMPGVLCVFVCLCLCVASPAATAAAAPATAANSEVSVAIKRARERRRVARVPGKYHKMQTP